MDRAGYQKSSISSLNRIFLYFEDLSASKIRKTGLIILVILVAIIGLVSTYYTSFVEKSLEDISYRLIPQQRDIDDILSRFLSIRRAFTTFVIDEKEDIRPIIKKTDTLIQASTNFLKHLSPEDARLMKKFIEKLQEFRAGMIGYSQELAIRRTGEGVRSWERTLLDIEEQAYRISSQLKENINNKIMSKQEEMIKKGGAAQNTSILLVIAGIIAGIIIAIMLHVSISGPVKKILNLTRKASNGDLTAKINYRAKDEFGELIKNLQATLENLSNLVARIKIAASEVEQAASQLNTQHNTLSAGAKRQREGILSVKRAIEKTDSTLRHLVEDARKLSESLEESSSSVAQMTASTEELFSYADRMFSELEQIISAVQENQQNIINIATLIEGLNITTEETRKNTEILNHSAVELGEKASSSKSLTEEVSKKAKTSGMDVVTEINELWEKNLGLVDEYSDIIESLKLRSTEVSRVLDIISDVADQTNLLSLNAAIIAAQAGEHGESFAVVADEIRKLSNNTQQNVKEIEQILKDIQDKSVSAVEMLKELQKATVKGTESVERLKKVFSDIAEASNRASEVAGQSSDIALLQADRCADIFRLVQESTDQLNKINIAVNEEKKTTELISTSTEELRIIADAVKRGADEQKTNTPIIAKTIEDVHKFSEKLLEMAEENREYSEESMRAADTISQITDDTFVTVEQISKLVSNFTTLVANLKNEVARFIISEKD